MPKGFIVKALSGFYYVVPESGQGESIPCRARGVFKKRGITPMVGDRIFFEMAGKEGIITEVFPRSTELLRPPVANADLAILVFSVAEPPFHLSLLDKFLIHAESAGLEALICLTKSDLLADLDNGERNRLDDAAKLYASIGYPVVFTSVKTKTGIGELRQKLSGHISVLCGQSGVGKSSLLNALVPNLQLKTGDISQKLGRGRHTTRHVELIPLGNGGFVADTPGFSQLDFLYVEPQDLGKYFREFARFSDACRFRGCLHLQEPGCAVIAAAESGELARTRYEHYVQFMEKLKEKKGRF